MNARRKEALRAVYESGFVLNELNLYLDTHPGCAEGLKRWQQARRDAFEARSRYESEFGPLTVCAAEDPDKCSWQWITAPWPWELEA